MIEPLTHAVEVSKVGPDGRVSHVTLTAAEYRRLVQEAGARAMERVEKILADSNAPWYDGQGVLDELHNTGNLADPEVHRVFNKQPLAAARKARGLTQKALGEKIGVPQSQISRIERHPERSSLGMLQRIAAALQIDVRQLV